MKIYDFKGFPNPARIRIALAEKGITDQVEFINIDVPSGQHKTPEFLAKNPNGLVPVLELDDGTMISECTAITEYIDHAFGGVSLTGVSPKERAVIHMMNRRAEAGLMEKVNDYFHHATPGLGPDIETDQNKEWGEKQREKAIKSMYYFDEELGKAPYIAGDQFSMADITLLAGLLYAGFAQIDVPEDCKNLAEWQDKLSQRPSMSA